MPSPCFHGIFTAATAAWLHLIVLVFVSPAAWKLLEGWSVLIPICILSTVSRTRQVPKDYLSK